MKRKVVAEVEVEIPDEEIQSMIRSLEKQVKSWQSKCDRRDAKIQRLEQRVHQLQAEQEPVTEFQKKLFELFELAKSTGYNEGYDEGSAEDIRGRY